MRRDYVLYRAGKNWAVFEKARTELPEWVREQLACNDFYIGVEADKEDVIRYLDKTLRIEESQYCLRTSHIEIDAAELASFTHFFILPKRLECDRQVFFDEIRPTCPKDGCVFGSRLVLPVRIPPKTARKVQIAWIWTVWVPAVELVVSPEFKRIFESEGVTGLDYDPCVFGDAKSVISLSEEPPYLAHIKNKISKRADELEVSKYQCEQHSLIMPCLNRRIVRSSLPEADFVEIEGITAQGRMYYYRCHEFIISQKVARLLVKHKVRGLANKGFFMDMKFTPAWISDE